MEYMLIGTVDSDKLLVVIIFQIVEAYRTRSLITVSFSLLSLLVLSFHFRFKPKPLQLERMLRKASFGLVLKK